MKISGLTIIRNGVKLGYPFLESMQSLLPICDEFIAVVGQSEDETRARIEALNSPKIKIIDTIWDPMMRKGGEVVAQQTNIGIQAATGDWIFYMQADDMIHEKDLVEIRDEMQACLHNPNIEGLLFPYYHFWTYDWITVGRAYRREIRIVRNLPGLRSYRDAQGFRIYPSGGKPSELSKGLKLKTRLIRPHVYAYGRVRPPKEEQLKIIEFVKLWQTDQEAAQRFEGINQFDYQKVGAVKAFPPQNHPALIMPRVKANTYHIVPQQGHYSFLKRLQYWIESFTGWRIGEYRNYKIVSRARG